MSTFFTADPLQPRGDHRVLQPEGPCHGRGTRESDIVSPMSLVLCAHGRVDLPGAPCTICEEVE
jgi:hypothetical protein